MFDSMRENERTREKIIFIDVERFHGNLTDLLPNNSYHAVQICRH